MGWLAALWHDVLRHVHEFEIAPPRTVDQLMAWIGLLALLYACFRYVRGWIATILLATPLFRVVVTAVQLRAFRQQLAVREARGMFEARLATLYLDSRLDGATAIFVLGFVLLGVAATVGHEAVVWLAIGFGALLFVSIEMTRADDRALMRLLAGKDSRYVRLLIRAKLYEAEFGDLDFLQDARAMIVEELPRVQEYLRLIRARLGLPEHDFPDLQKVTSSSDASD